eukprot:COSAG02_NODE_13639_length_1368_cov_2.152876_1_plen_75_part_00
MLPYGVGCGLAVVLHAVDAVCERCCGRNILPFESESGGLFMLVILALSIGIAVYIELPKQPDDDERLASVLTNV